MTGERSLIEAATQLSHSSTVSFNLGMKGNLPEKVRESHWIYVPDSSLPFYRVGFYSNIGVGTSPPGFSSMYVECSFKPSDVPIGQDLSDLQGRVVRELERLGWVDPHTTTCVVAHTIPHAYVHHTPAHHRVVSQIMQELEHYSVHPIGRYGMWDYIAMEDSIHSALSTIEKVL